MSRRIVSRRKFVRAASLATVGAATFSSRMPKLFATASSQTPLEQFGYGEVKVSSALHREQLEQTHSVLMGLNEDSLMKPFRQMAGQPAPGENLGGWYNYEPDYDYHTFDAGFAPAATFGQWVSAHARYYATTGDPATRDKILRLNRLYGETISDGFYQKNRFPAYCYDKLVLGLIDSHTLAGDPDAYRILERTTDTAVKHLPGKAIPHDQPWLPGKDISWTWDESYTLPENLFLAYQRGAGERYRDLASQYLYDDFFDPFAEGHSAFAGKHAYSHVNALSSAMQAYLTLGNEKYLRASKTAFDMLQAQSFATGGWGPDELLRAPGSDDVHSSLSGIHHSFETPCGSYAHFKLTRYLMRVTRDSRYGDSMERVMYNTVLGAKPLESDGHAFYYSDYTFHGSKIYSDHRWPCCSGTLPQVAADYGVNSYLRDAHGVFVSLYIPSSVRWMQDGTQVSLTQNGNYPFDSLITFEFTSSRPTEFELNLRIPNWAEGTSISVNGKRLPSEIAPGYFAMLRRSWKTGDRVELELPLRQRLEAVDARHPKTVALLAGPLVLFPIGENLPEVSEKQLLSAKKTGAAEWRAETVGKPLRLLPFTEIGDEAYSTYLRIG
jgi:uncharacterized protein